MTLAPQKPSSTSLVLPVDDSQFADFIKGLLGRPQSLIKRIRGSFEIGRPQVQQIHNLLRQRIEQQNSGCLVRFEARLGLADDEMVVFNTIEELLAYDAPRRITSSFLDIAWDYLVKFSDKKTPERQRIQIKIRSESDLSNNADEEEDTLYLGPGRIHMLIAARLLSFRIEYTARTWGEDIDSMLSKYLHSITCKPKGASRMLMLHAGKISATIAFLFYASIVYGCFSATAAFSGNNVSRVQKAVENIGGADVEVIKQELDLLLNLHAEGAWAAHILMVSVILVVAIPLTILLATWTSAVSYRPKPSFILWTAEDDVVRSAILEKHKRRAFWYCFSIAVNLAVSVTANLLFRAYF